MTGSHSHAVKPVIYSLKAMSARNNKKALLVSAHYNRMSAGHTKMNAAHNKMSADCNKMSAARNKMSAAH